MQKKCASIIFVHSGESPPPEYLTNALVMAAKVAPQSQVYALVNKSFIGDLQLALQDNLGGSDNPLQNIAFVAIEDIPQSDITKHFAKNAALDRNFRNGFWFSASYRFFVLADFIQFKGLENCIHLENDVVLYFDPSEKLDQFISFARFAVPVDRARAIPGIVWIKDASIASELVKFIADRSDANDMDSLGAFAMREDLGAKPLPTIPLGYAKSKTLDLTRYCQGIDLFGGIFDGAAIGQYVGGVHWMNDPSDTRFFENESSDFHLKGCHFSWGYERFYRSPFVSFDGACTKVLALHAHSKDLLGVSPFNSGVPSSVESMLTGERIQALADLTISSAGVTAFHGREKIQTPVVLEITEKEEKKWFKKKRFELPPDLDFLRACQGAKIIFVYTHLLAYFKSFVAPRLHEPFVLLTHNSDHGVGLGDLDLLNHPSLVAWYAQNCETSHTKLHALPIGLANSQWGPTRVSGVFDAGHVYQKTKNLYVNFSASTHSARQSIIDVVSNVSDVTMGASVGFEQYIAQVSEHRFCLCPRGNGIDTHRFWEAQYVDTIPVLLKQDWTSAYSNLPVLLVDAWEDLLRLNWEEAYIRGSTSNFDRKTLTLEYYRQQLLANI